MDAPQGYQKIKVHLVFVFACNHDGGHQTRVVEGLHLAPDQIDSIYSGVSSTRSLRLNIASQIEQHGSLGVDIGNAYLEATTKEKHT